MFALGLVGTLVTSLVSPWLVHSVLKIPAPLQAETLHAFYMLAVGIPIVVVTAGLVGINARLVNAMAAAIAVVTVGVGGAALGMRATFDSYSGATQLLFAFEAAVIGGTGSVWGTLLGGIVLALAQLFGAQISPLGFLIGGHVVFLLVLLGRLVIPGFGFRTLFRRRT